MWKRDFLLLGENQSLNSLSKLVNLSIGARLTRGDEVERPALIWETTGLLRVERTLDLFSMIAKASLVVLLKKLPPAEALRES